MIDAHASTGTVIAVRGAVVDVRFDSTALPAIDTALIVDWDRPEPLVLEVHSQLGHGTRFSFTLPVWTDGPEPNQVDVRAGAGLVAGGSRS